MAANREYKDSVFRMIFKEPEYAGQLCSGMLGEPVAPEEIVVEPSGGIFTNELQHDVALRVRNRLLFLLAHQSTWNENMPLRMLLEAAELYHRYIKSLGKRAIYRMHRIPLPVPEFLLFCNGKASHPPAGELRLSEAFGTSDSNLELIVKVYDISFESQAEILQTCPAMRGYSRLVHQTELGKKQGNSAEAAIRQAIIRCQETGELATFLEKYREEVQQAMMFEYNREDELEARREDGYEEGRMEGRMEGRAEGESKLARLMTLLLRDGKEQEMQEILSDKDMRQELYALYDL